MKAVIREAKWADVADECEALGARHHPEATEGREGKFAFNRELMAALDGAGYLRVFVADLDGVLVGYCIWTKGAGLEVRTARVMDMGPFYAVPEVAGLCLGRKMLAYCRDVFRLEGYDTLTLHHTMHGRGAKAGALYRLMGAAEYERKYLLDLAGV